MLKITGLDKLQRQLEDAQRAFQALNGQFAEVRFDPNNQASVQAAIEAMESAIDQKVAPYLGNALVENIVPRMKAKYREAILERAENAKLAS